MRTAFDRGAVRIVTPSAARWHHIAVSIERDHGPIAEAVPDDEIGRADHSDCFHGGARHRVRLDR